MPAQGRTDLQLGACRVVSSGFTMLSGIVKSITKNAPGDWTITTEPYDADRVKIRAQRLATIADDGHLTVSPIDETHIRVFGAQGSVAVPRRFLLMGAGAKHAFVPNIQVAHDLGGAAWDDADGAEGGAVIAAPKNLAVADVAGSTSNLTRFADGNYFMRQWIIGDPNTQLPLALPAKTIKGTVTGFIRGRESVGAAVIAPIFKLFVVDSTRLVYRGTLFDLAAGTQGGFAYPAANATLRTAQIPHGASIALNPVTSQAGDIVVIEGGHNQSATGVSATSAMRSLGDSVAADAAANDDTTNVNTWIEFSQDPLSAGDPPLETDFYLTIQRR